MTNDTMKALEVLDIAEQNINDLDTVLIQHLKNQRALRGQAVKMSFVKFRKI